MQVWPISDYFHDTHLAMPSLSDRYTGKPLGQRTLFYRLPKRALDVVVGLRESGQASPGDTTVRRLNARAAEDLRIRLAN